MLKCSRTGDKIEWSGANLNSRCCGIEGIIGDAVRYVSSSGTILECLLMIVALATMTEWDEAVW